MNQLIDELYKELRSGIISRTSSKLDIHNALRKYTLRNKWPNLQEEVEDLKRFADRTDGRDHRVERIFMEIFSVRYREITF